MLHLLMEPTLHDFQHILKIHFLFLSFLSSTAQAEIHKPCSCLVGRKQTLHLLCECKIRVKSGSFVLSVTALLSSGSYIEEKKNESFSYGAFATFSGPLSFSLHTHIRKHAQLICEHSCCFYFGFVKEGTTELKGSGTKVDLMWHLISCPI